MKRFKATTCTALLIMTVSSTSLAGTIVGARTNRTGTIVGARSGNIAGTRSGNLDAGLSQRNDVQTKFDFDSIIAESMNGLLRLFLTRSLF
ncbi:MAG TPA: hypothetical protein VJP89_11805 [Pyrinomonadaceae bacterium]|nr:hypothetical protein [Pyrinomonadaceae bacterium]